MALTINGTGLDTIGWWLVRSTGLWDRQDRALTLLDLPGRRSQVVTSHERSLAPVDAVLTLACRADDASGLATKRNALDGLLFAGPTVTLTHTRRPSQERIGVVIGSPVTTGIGPEARGPFYEEVGLKVKLLEPWRDSTDQTTNFTTSPVAIAMGTLDSTGVITITASGGTVNNPVVTVKTGAGATIATLAPTISILGGDAWQADCVRNVIRKRVSSVWSNAIDTLPDSFQLPVLRREHFTYGTNSPTIESTGGAGTFVQRRRWS